jgi:hypothetical protein
MNLEGEVEGDKVGLVLLQKQVSEQNGRSDGRIRDNGRLA